jgi:hypothetical protein
VARANRKRAARFISFGLACIPICILYTKSG